MSPKVEVILDRTKYVVKIDGREVDARFVSVEGAPGVLPRVRVDLPLYRLHVRADDVDAAHVDVTPEPPTPEPEPEPEATAPVEVVESSPEVPAADDAPADDVVTFARPRRRK